MAIFKSWALLGMAVLALAGTANAQPPLAERLLPAVVVPSTAGKVIGLSINSDEFIWDNFVKIVKPVVATPGLVEFQTWASDEDLYTANPQWPTPESAAKLRNNIVARARLRQPAGNARVRARHQSSPRWGSRPGQCAPDHHA